MKCTLHLMPSIQVSVSKSQSLMLKRRRETPSPPLEIHAEQSFKKKFYMRIQSTNGEDKFHWQSIYCKVILPRSLMKGSE